MIRRRNVVMKAFCDCCGGKLSSEGQENTDGTPRDVHYGELKNEFGYGSPLDGIDNALGNLHLCEACYKKAFKALGLPLSQYDTPWHLNVRTEAFRMGDDKPYEVAVVGVEMYWLPVWSCIYCDWVEAGRGYSTPLHNCENVIKIAEVRHTCSLCNGHEDFESMPYYASHRDEWVHHYKSEKRPSGAEDPKCEVNDIRLELMKKGTRTDPEEVKRCRAENEMIRNLAEKKDGA